jgi:membrane fusion protein (multidrug efflux system)
MARFGRLSRWSHVCVAWLVLGALAQGCAPSGERSGADAAARPGARAGEAAGDVDVVAVRPSVEPDGMWETVLEPVTDAPVLARADGLVQAVLVEEGRRVAKGQPLARLESQEQRLEVEYTGALAAQAKAELDRAEKGASGQWISQQTLDAARAKARATQADLALAELALERRTVRAPCSGVVWQVRARASRMVRAGDPMFRVTDPSRLRAELYLPPSLARRLKPGTPVALDPLGDASDEASIAARVRAVSPLTDPATGRVRVEVEATGTGIASAGASVRARPNSVGWGTAAGGTMTAGAVLPRGAALERSGTDFYVWRVEDGHVAKTRVELGAATSDGYEVTSGLSAGDWVCAAGTNPPADGAVVRPRLVAGAD